MFTVLTLLPSADFMASGLVFTFKAEDSSDGEVFSTPKKEPSRLPQDFLVALSDDAVVSDRGDSPIYDHQSFGRVQP